MNNIVVECRRCKGKGTIVCTRCGGVGSIPSFGLSLSGISQGLPGYGDCSICKGIGELQCTACAGKAAYARYATNARLVLAIHHLLDQANANFSNKAAEIRFIAFLTGRNKDDIDEKTH